MRNILIIILCLVSFFAKGQDSLMTSKGVKRDTASLLSAYKVAIATNTTAIAGKQAAIINYPVTNSSFALGNSILAGYGNTNATSFFGMTNSYSGSKMTDLSLSATGTRYAYSQLSKNKIYNFSSPLLLAAPQFNDMRVTATSQSIKYERAKAGVRAIAALHWLNNIYFMWPGSGSSLNSNVTLNVGGWAYFTTEAALLDYGSRTYWYRHNDIVNNPGANVLWKNSTSAGESLTMTGIQGNSVVIGTWGSDGVTNNFSRIQYAVDGVTYGTYTPNGKTYLGYSDGGTTDGIINDAIVVTGLSDSSHTLILTFLDSGAKTYIDYVGTLINSNASKSNPIYSLDCFRMSNNAGIGYNLSTNLSTQNIIDSTTLLVNQDIAATFPNYRFIKVKTNQYYDPSISAQIQLADGVHPTILGDQKIFQAIADSMSSIPAVGTSPVIASSTNVQFGGTLTANRIVKSSTSTAVINSTLSDDGTQVTQATGNPIFKIQDINGSSAGFLGGVGTVFQLAVNRNPNTGTFTDASKASAQITLDGATSNGQIYFYTGASNGGVPSQRMNISAAGNVGIGLSPTTDKLEIAGNIALTTAGNKLKITTGANASVGTATLVAGTVTVSTTAALTASLIYVTVKTAGGTQGFLSVPTITNATSFVINSTSATETSTVNWWIIN